MTVVALDDTDSRTAGMCTTYAAHLVAEELRAAGCTVHRVLLVRLNPAVAYKTRGNAALAVHADVDPQVGFDTARRVVDAHAEIDDDRTNPGVVVAHD
ncbi:tRNA(Ile2) 2-agmatinylcytidine synthetase, partial [Halobacterium salinarum]|nr:tRNA(Ile2) 2-agmatinylcytidine synthetase [Halobacterium salinarum]